MNQKPIAALAFDPCKRLSAPLPAAPIIGGLRLLQSSEVKKLFGYTNTSSFWAAVRKAGIPHIRINPRRIVFEEAAVRAWIESKTVGRRARDFPVRAA
jgi:predicted DNA-binding transcriptional regulator AlpA